MKNLTFIVLAFFISLASCSNNDETTQDREAVKLEKMYNEIITMSLADSQACVNAEEWDFTNIDSKSCGSNRGYIVYSKKINKADFLKKVTDFNNAQLAYYSKWKISSTCEIAVPPAGIECVNNKPSLVFNHQLY